MHAAVLDVMGSGQLSASGLVFAGPGWVTNLGIITDGSDNVTATLSDSATGANGTIIEGPLVVVGSAWFGGRSWNHPRCVTNGIYLVLSGTSAIAIVEYAAR